MLPSDRHQAAKCESTANTLPLHRKLITAPFAQVAQQAQAALELGASMHSLAIREEDLAAQLEACRQEVEEGRDALSRERHAKEMAASQVVAHQAMLEMSGSKQAAAILEVDGLSARCQILGKDLEVPPHQTARLSDLPGSNNPAVDISVSDIHSNALAWVFLSLCVKNLRKHRAGLSQQAWAYMTSLFDSAGQGQDPAKLSIPLQRL